ncbi:hypothetical protein TNIN_341791 [Trichonephila inaurata madagascariensis]|uniref:Uncharacterized protein n=1 Tax=Trichonephila inaurata madagascariensis TaxID=2747483 RepID=A0A8X7C197_9ARAC|nr:hypothetical protein TNIN_341791 [Trichonephila inaurata madagascariensis]
MTFTTQNMAEPHQLREDDIVLIKEGSLLNSNGSSSSRGYGLVRVTLKPNLVFKRPVQTKLQISDKFGYSGIPWLNFSS